MKCEDIFFKKILVDSIYSIHNNDCMNKHYSCVETYPQGKIAYLKQALYEIRKQIMEKPNVLTRSWHNSKYCLDMFNDENKRKRLFDYLDDCSRQSLERVRHDFRKAGVNDAELEKEIEISSKREDDYYCKIIGEFWDYYSQYVAISNYLQRLELEEAQTHKPKAKQEVSITIDRHNEAQYRKLFKALKQHLFIEGNENVFLDMCAGVVDEPKTKLQWKLKSHRSKSISTISLCELLQAIGKDEEQIKKIVPLYFELNIFRAQINRMRASTKSEYFNAINDFVTKYIPNT